MNFMGQYSDFFSYPICGNHETNMKQKVYLKITAIW